MLVTIELTVMLMHAGLNVDAKWQMLLYYMSFNKFTFLCVCNMGSSKSLEPKVGTSLAIF